MEHYLEKAPFLNSDNTILSLYSVSLTTCCCGEDLGILATAAENEKTLEKEFGHLREGVLTATAPWRNTLDKRSTDSFPMFKNYLTLFFC